jgi:hypothetical protein
MYVHYIGARPTWFYFLPASQAESRAPLRFAHPTLETTGLHNLLYLLTTTTDLQTKG